jgi:hypothetical protein
MLLSFGAAPETDVAKWPHRRPLADQEQSGASGTGSWTDTPPVATRSCSGLSAWLAQLTARTHRNVAAVALANKLARMAWAVLAKNEQYRPPVLADVAAA